MADSVSERRAPWWRRVPLGQRMAFAYGALMIAVLALTLLIIDNFQQQRLAETIREKLQIGQQVFDRASEQNRALLIQAAQVLAADFGFREAVSSNDADTIRSALDNHRSRIGADLAILANLDGQVQQHSEIDNSLDSQQLRSVFQRASAGGVASAIINLDQQWYQLVVVTVRAPNPIALVALGFAVGRDDINDLRTLTGLDIAFVQFQDLRWLSNLHSLEHNEKPLFIEWSPENEKVGKQFLHLNNQRYAGILRRFEQQADDYAALLLVSEQEISAPYYELRRFLMLLGLLSIAVTLLVVWWMARGIVRPVIGLQRAAERMAAGDFHHSLRIDRHDEVGRLAATFNNMAGTIADRERQVRFLAFNDPLTSLPNRLGFQEKMHQLIETEPAAFALLLINIDRFKLINSTLGYSTADQVLVMASERLQQQMPDNAVLARLVGDEFAVLLPDSDVAKARLYAERIRMALREPFQCAGRLVDVRVTISYAVYPRHGQHAQELIRAADLALHAAKANKQSLQLFDPSLRPFRPEHLSLLGELNEAMRQAQLKLYFQPKVPLDRSSTRYAEVLIRWLHPHRGMIPPIEFIPFAEQTGDIKQLTRWVIENAFRQCADWLAQQQPIHLSINISSHDLLDESFSPFVQQQLLSAGVPPALICLEITESSFVDDPQRAMRSLQQLRELGLQLSIDDFGTGYSSLSYLRQLPVQELKIDRAFIMSLQAEGSDAAIVKSTIELGHNLGMRIVAEGVETEAQVMLLRDWGCDFAQGYLFSKPVDGHQYIAHTYLQSG